LHEENELLINWNQKVFQDVSTQCVCVMCVSCNWAIFRKGIYIHLEVCLLNVKTSNLLTRFCLVCIKVRKQSSVLLYFDRVVT